MYMYVFVYTCTCMHYMCACDNVNPVELYWTRCTRVVVFEVNPLLHNSVVYRNTCVPLLHNSVVYRNTCVPLLHNSVVYRNTCTHEHNGLVPATELHNVMVHRRNPTLHQCVHAYARRASCGLTIIMFYARVGLLTYVQLSLVQRLVLMHSAICVYNTISVLLHVCLDGTTRPFQPYQPGVLPERPPSE